MNDHYDNLGKLQDYFAQYKALPSYRYMSELFKIKSTETISKLVAKLKEEQFLDLAPDNKLIPGKRFFDIPYSDAAVQAGEFTNSHSQGESYMTVLDILIKKPSITRIRPVKGNSMSKKGILDGDMAIYEKRHNANVGQIVLALLEGSDDITIKELGKENGQYILIPHNDKFEVIRKKPFRIEGVLVTTFRTYN